MGSLSQAEKSECSESDDYDTSASDFTSEIPIKDNNVENEDTIKELLHKIQNIQINNKNSKPQINIAYSLEDDRDLSEETVFINSNFVTEFPFYHLAKEASEEEDMGFINLNLNMMNRKDSKNHLKLETTYSSWKDTACSICFETITKLCILECGHYFCLACVEAYISCAMNSGRVKNLPCPDVTCNTHLSDFDVRCALEPAEYYRYCLAKSKTYAKRRCDEIWCPNTDCDGCASATSDRKWVKCNTCATDFCKKCRLLKHEGMSCKKAKRKAKKADPNRKKEKSSTKWKSKHTKPCPSCTEVIEKDGGCHHVTCSTCNHTWCWKCGAAADGPFHCTGKKVATVIGGIIASPVLIVGGIVGGAAYLVESRIIKRGSPKAECITYNTGKEVGNRLFLKFYWLID